MKAADKVEYAMKAVRDFATLSPERQRKTKKQLSLLLQDLRHPSLRAKRYDERRGLWQARIDGGYRFYFRIAGDTYQILSIVPHPK